MRQALLSSVGRAQGNAGATLPHDRGRPYGWLRRRSLPLILFVLCAAVVLFRRGRQVVQVTASSSVVLERCRIITRVLVAHEQHLQQVGSDTRLLLLLQHLRQLGASVSLLVRAATGVARHHPPTHEVAKLLGATNLSAVPLGRGDVSVSRAPAIYEMGGSRAFQQLLRREQFDLVLVGLWFWYDPQPSFAEMLVPLVVGVARRAVGESHGLTRGSTGSGPLLALLCDDAHSERAARLQREETHAASQQRYGQQAHGAVH